jgi:Protein of unknown function (DUF4240)
VALLWLAGCADDAAPPAAPPVPTPAAAPAQSTQPTPQARTANLGEPQFWQLVEDARRDAGDDTERQSELLASRLEQLPAETIADFGAIHRRLDRRAYTWELWGAASVIDDGCSDDCFRDFRAYLISLGQGPYEAALKAPDSLAPVVEDAETGDWENADDVAPEAYEGVAGEDIPSGDTDLSGRPRGQEWDDEQQDALVQRYPALAARFR